MNRGEPLYFGPDHRPLFGWLHRAPSPLGLGLVLCNPFGFEAICTHRSLRHFAEAAAAANIPSLRFDYDGTGDSAGDDRDPARLAAWVASVGHAVSALRAQAGVERVAILGIRLGALVAVLAACARDDVDSLITIAPVVAGKPYLRELRVLQMALNLGAPPPGALVDQEVQEALGFTITAETRSAIGQVDLTRLEKPPAPSLLLLERNDLPGNDAWPERLSSQGVTVERRRLPGFVEMSSHPEYAVVPEEMVRAVVEWVVRRAARFGASRAPDAAAPARRVLVSPGIVESAHFLGDGGRLFGVLSTPESPPPARRALLLLNAGAIYRIGPNRLHVALARRWAALGHAVLRLDVSGIGDSLPVPGAPENVVYTDTASDDIAQALALLRRQPGVTEVQAFGLCSGGYNAFKAAVAGVPLDGVLLINPLIFFFKANLPPAEAAIDQAAHEFTFDRFPRRLLSPDAWKKLLRGEVPVADKAKVMARRFALLLRDRTRGVARRAGLRMGDDLAYELASVARKKIRLRFLFAAGDPGISLLSAQGGAMVEKLRQRGELEMDVIDGPDHIFTPLWSHPVLTSALAAYFDGPPGARR